MKYLSAMSLALIMSPQVFAAACPSSSSNTTAGNGNCTVTGTASSIQLNFNSGFDVATGAAAIDGNNGTTVGAQRKLAFIKAAEIIADQVGSSVPIVVDADFSSLSCNASSATLGSAGASSNTGYNAPAPAGLTASTFYPIGLINAIRETDIDAGTSDVSAQFNSDIGTTGCLQSSNGWYYGFASPGTGFIGFTTVLLHEVTHGLGFASLTNGSTGAKASGIDDIFSNFLYSVADGKTWSVADGMSNGERVASAASNTGLLWTGTNTNSNAEGVLTNGFNDVDSDGVFEPGDRIQMYAPNPFESGSSVSHFNTAAFPNELMEPQYTEGQYTLGLATSLLKDIGWTIVTPAANTAPILSNIGNQSAPVNVDLTVNLAATDAQGDTLTYSITNDPDNVTSLSGSTLTLNDPIVDDYSVTVQVSDGNLTDSEIFTFSTYAEPNINVNSTSLDPSDSLDISNTTTSIDLSSVNAFYNYELTLNGANAASLVSVNGTNLNIAMPSSGQFAGEYVLTFTDANTGEMYDFTLVRDPRMVFSASKLLDNTAVQTLDIEGGASNTVYTLNSSEGALAFSKNNSAVTTATADGNAASFNKASVTLVTDNVVSSTAVTVSASSIYNTVDSTGITVEPARTHTLNIVDTDNNVLEGVTLTLDTSTLAAYNLAADYVTNNQGQTSIALPDNSTDYSAVASLSFYGDVNVTLDDSVLTQTVTMEQVINPMFLSGTISAGDNVSFANELPVLTLVLSDNSEINIPLNQTSSTQATYDYVYNLDLGDATALLITHSQSDDVTETINTSNDVTFDVELASNASSSDNNDSDTTEPNNGNDNSGNIDLGGSSGGSLGGHHGIWALLLLTVVMRRRTKA